MIRFLEKYVMPIAGKVAEQRHLQAIRDGIILTMPFLIIGSFFLIISALPIPGYNEFMAGLFGENWQRALGYPVSATFNIMALIAVFGIAYRLGEYYKVDALASGALSLVTFLLATPFQVAYIIPSTKESVLVEGAIPAVLMGSQGLFVAMIIALISTELYRFIVQKKIIIKMPETVPPAVTRSFAALVPGFIVVTVIWILRLIIENTSFGSIHNIVGQILQEPLSVLGASLWGAIIAVILVHVLWSCGIHGATIVGGVMSPVWLSLMDQNRVAFQAGQDVPNTITAQFFDLWIYMGGSGATLALVVGMLLFARSQQLKSLGRLSIAPGIFNINEMVTFGMPIVMNPLLLIPFILVPVVLTIVSYFAMEWEWVARPSGAAVPWTTPILFSGYLGSGGKISGVILQLVNFALAFFIYLPFLKIWDKQKLAEEKGE
ncbi:MULTISPECIES: PTS cellobiose transporter subunit IIC [Bacillus cereus group]|uniref:Permease IIC component n=1 Tax=Bacillus cereus TaxID=1396 RepID=A0A9W7QKS4_BACCE|nr:PTS cellobiose transporter subunit IIC [Bacillus cereus]KAB2400009.1 PTS cellobiose transporter subunit IIC [Bacillus cereus]KAB2410563.1 PTS cellobiose transporter subunit IIC [Bacillus cereus]KAB2427643.1 PTS cellobiose transporter subunit IIC [Bacillus cereus]